MEDDVFKTPAARRKKNQEYKDENREQVRAQNAAYMRERRATSQDAQFRLRDEQRRTFSRLIQANVKYNAQMLKMATWLGMTPAKFRDKLQSEFTNGWGWHNFGKLWVIDHIKPLVSFDLSDDAQCAQAWHNTNLRPLDKLQNTLKGAN